MPQLLLTPTSLSVCASAGLAQALLLVERRLAGWGNDPAAFDALLQQVFGIEPNTNRESAGLLTTINESDLELSIPILDATSIDGFNAA